MDIQGATMFYDVCRLCLDRRGEQSMFENEELPHDIFACTGVRVKSTDKLPHTICKICFDTITKAKELRKLALENDTNLRVLFDEDIDSDEEQGRLVIDETVDKNENVETIQSILNEGRLVDVSLIVEKVDNKPLTSINVRKDLFAASRNNQSPDSSSILKESSENSPKKPKLMVKNRKVLAVGGKKDISKKLRDELDVEYQCPTCRKEFDTSKKLYLHQRLHNKSIACPDCPKKFATKGDLQKHQRTHTGERPFVCDTCGKRFTQKVTLKLHIDAVHAD